MTYWAWCQSSAARHMGSSLWVLASPRSRQGSQRWRRVCSVPGGMWWPILTEKSLSWKEWKNYYCAFFVCLGWFSFVSLSNLQPVNNFKSNLFHHLSWMDSVLGTDHPFPWQCSASGPGLRYGRICSASLCSSDPWLPAPAQDPTLCLSHFKIFGFFYLFYFL